MMPNHEIPVEEVFSIEKALKTIAGQVTAIFQALPGLMETMRAVAEQQKEHERRIIRLEGLIQDIIDAREQADTQP
jgi:hypothetical protein